MTCIDPGHQQVLSSVSNHLQKAGILRELTLIVPVRLNVPVGVGITRIVVLGAGNLNLSETPLRQIDIAGAEVATHDWVFQAEGSGQRANFASITRGNISHDLNLPVIFVVAYSKVAVAGDFLVRLGDRSGDLMRVKVAAGLGMNQANGLAVTNESGLGILIVIGITTVGVEEPVIVSILVVVASNLLLGRSLGISLHVRMKKTTN